MEEKIQEIIPVILPFGCDAKIFSNTDEDGNIVGPPFSYNDFIQACKDIAGVSEDLMGKKE